MSFPTLRTAAVLLSSIALSGTTQAQERIRYQVIVNPEEQYAVWVADEQVPTGWKATGRTGGLGQAMDYIEEVWTDMRPRSLRTRMAQRGIERDAIKYQVLVRKERTGDDRENDGIPSGYYGYMLWPAEETFPEELTPTGKVGTFGEASEYIEEVWTDMRPLSLRRRLERG